MGEKFTIRKTAPEKTNKFYLRTVAGGYSHCIAGKPSYCEGSTLANCVGYAWGRAAELENDPKCDIGVPDSRLKAGKHNPTSPQLWLNYAHGRKTGTTPRVGAVAVWKHKTKDSGHVAIVGKVNPDGSWVSEESSYDGKTFRNVKYNKKSARSNYIFKGFIYLRVEFDPEMKFKVGDKVKIVAGGNTRKDGKGKACGGRGYTRYVLAVYPNQPYPYQVGSKLRITTGFYKENALKKV